MAVQLPNFLAVQPQRPDFSGLSDLFENYYGGKGLKHQDTMNQFQEKGAPLDLLIKQIQAEFARPNAETALAGAKLGNRSSELSNRQAEMTLQKLRKELSNQASIEASVKEALAKGASGGGQGFGGGMGGGGSTGMIPMGNSPSLGGQAPSMMTSAPQEPTREEAYRHQENGTALQKGLMEVMQHQAMKNQPMPTQTPLMIDHPAETMNQPKGQSKTQEISRGNPAWYGIDELWERNPKARDYIAKNFDKKEQKEEYDKKTGMTILRTKWPSGRRTVETFLPQVEQDEGEDIPLSKSGIVKVEDEIRGADSLIPYLDALIEMSKPRKVVEGMETSDLPTFSSLGGFMNFPSNASTKYHRLVNKALESYAASGKLPKTNESIERVHQILSRGSGETDRQFHEELVKEKKEQLAKRARNAQLLKKGINKFGTSALEPAYSSNEWEPTNEK